MTTQNSLIIAAADLLRRKPSTDIDDYPRIPIYYLRDVCSYTDRARQAAILMRTAANQITELEGRLKLVKKWSAKHGPVEICMESWDELKEAIK